MHCGARGLCEQRDEQEIDEVDEGEGIVPEQASCTNTETQVKIEQQIHLLTSHLKTTDLTASSSPREKLAADHEPPDQESSLASADLGETRW